MAWIELHQTLPTNRKTMRFKNLLGIKTPQAVGHLCMLWLWALDNAADGNLESFSAEDITEVCEFQKNKSQKFLEALIKSGFVDDDMMIHDWNDYAGRLLAHRDIKREQSRLRQKKYREKLKNETEKNDNENYTLLTHNKSVTNTPIQYPTEPYPTLLNISILDNREETSEEQDEERKKIKRMGGKLGKNVIMLSDEQSDLLLDMLDIDGYNYYIERLANFIINKKANVKNHYQTILRWVEEDKKI